MPTVLAILADGFEEIEAVTPIDLLRRAGAGVTVAALAESTHVTGRSGLTLHADTTFVAILNGTHDFDCIILPGGPGVAKLRADARVASLLLRQHAAGRWIGAICAAPTVLNDAGLLASHRFTAHHSVALELPELIAGERVITDDRIVTSRGAGTALDFGLMLVEKLFTLEKAREIARCICV